MRHKRGQTEMNNNDARLARARFARDPVPEFYNSLCKPSICSDAAGL